MARNAGSNVLGFFVVGVVTIAAGAALGYYVIGGDRSNHTTPQVVGVQESTPPPAAPPPRIVTVPRAPTIQSSANYTAPGAPRIHIVEDPAPALPSGTHPTPRARRADDTSPTNIPTPDVEASQEAGNDNGSGQSGAAPTPNSITTDTVPAHSSSPPASSTPVAPPAPPSAPSSAAGSGASQPGPGTSATATSSGRISYRIQAAGAFSTAAGAQTYADSLSGKGVPASVSSQRKDGQTVYRVQVGAFRDRTDAQQAASDLRHQGVPVTVNNVSP